MTYHMYVYTRAIWPQMTYNMVTYYMLTHIFTGKNTNPPRRIVPQRSTPLDLREGVSEGVGGRNGEREGWKEEGREGGPVCVGRQGQCV